MRKWWDNFSQIGPEYGYYPNASNTWLIVKEEKCDEAKEFIQGTGVAITSEGKIHLRSAIGSQSFMECYVKKKVSGWKREIERLSEIAKTQPQAAYAAFIHGW